MAMIDTIKGEIKSHFEIPRYIEICADAVRYDLLHGPAWALIPQDDITKFDDENLYATYAEDLEDDKKEGDVIVQVYTSKVADALREYIDDLPSDLYYDVQSGELLDREPESFEDEIENPDYDPDDADSEEFIKEIVEPSEYYAVDRHTIIEALFGKTIAKEF